VLILWLLGFGVVNIIGLNPDEVQVGDFVVELSNNGFYTWAQVWIRMHNGAGGWESQQNSKGSTILPPTLRRISALGSEI
jgi:hypothetical protein